MVSRSLFSASQKSTFTNYRIRHTDYSATAARKMIATDLFILLAIGIGTAFLRWENIRWFNARSSETILLYLVPLVWFIALAWSNAWVFSTLPASSELYVRVLKAGMLTFVSVAGISFVFKAEFSREYLLISVSIGTGLLLLQRKIAKVRYERACQKLSLRKKGLFLSATPANKIFDEVQLDFPDSDLHFYFHSSDSEVDGSGLREFILNEGLDFVVPCPEFLNDVVAVRQLIEMLDHLDCQLYLVDSLGVFAARRGPVLQGSLSYSVISEPLILHSKAVFKRAIDIWFASIALVLLLPLILVIALVIKISSPGPIFYLDSRIGRNGALFKFPKFRTMRVGADKERLDILGRPDQEMADRYRRDPRITKFGRLLRRFSLDEIPQFVCVLAGSMSIVGPRPILAEEISQMESRTRYRQIALPGLTGLWQVSGRKETTWEERMEMDLKYVYEWSPYLDLFLILRTIRVVLTGAGAF